MTKGRVEVITSVERRRRFSSAEKQQLVSASLEPGVSVSAVAREAGIHPGQGFLADNAHDCGRSQPPGRQDRLHLGTPHLGLRDEPEPSLKIPGIIISLIFNEQRKLVFRATPLQN